MTGQRFAVDFGRFDDLLLGLVEALLADEPSRRFRNQPAAEVKIRIPSNSDFCSHPALS